VSSGRVFFTKKVTKLSGSIHCASTGVFSAATSGAASVATNNVPTGSSAATRLGVGSGAVAPFVAAALALVGGGAAVTLFNVCGTHPVDRAGAFADDPRQCI
jgi:hypothetical protein